MDPPEKKGGDPPAVQKILALVEARNVSNIRRKLAYAQMTAYGNRRNTTYLIYCLRVSTET